MDQMKEASKRNLHQRIRLFESGRVSSVMVRRWSGDETLANVDIHSRVAYLDSMLAEGRISRNQYDEQMGSLTERKRETDGVGVGGESCREPTRGVKSNNKCSGAQGIMNEDSDEDNDVHSRPRECNKLCGFDEGGQAGDLEARNATRKVTMTKLQRAFRVGPQRNVGHRPQKAWGTGVAKDSTGTVIGSAISLDTSKQEDDKMKRQKQQQTFPDAPNARDDAGSSDDTSEDLEPSCASNQHLMLWDHGDVINCEEHASTTFVTSISDQLVQQESSAGTEEGNNDVECQKDVLTHMDSSLEITDTVATAPRSSENILSCNGNAYTSAITSTSHHRVEQNSGNAGTEEHNDDEMCCDDTVAHMDPHQEAAGAVDTASENLKNAQNLDEHVNTGSVTFTSTDGIEQTIDDASSKQDIEYVLSGNNTAAHVAFHQGGFDIAATPHGSCGNVPSCDENVIMSTITSTSQHRTEQNIINTDTKKYGDDELCQNDAVLDVNGHLEGSSMVVITPCTCQDDVNCDVHISGSEVISKHDHAKGHKDSIAADEGSSISGVHPDSPVLQEDTHKEAARLVDFVMDYTYEDDAKGSNVVLGMPEELETDVCCITEDSDCCSPVEYNHDALKTQQLMMSENDTIHGDDKKDNCVGDDNMTNPQVVHSSNSVGEHRTCNQDCIRSKRGRWPVFAAAVGLVAVMSVRTGLGRH